MVAIISEIEDAASVEDLDVRYITIVINAGVAAADLIGLLVDIRGAVLEEAELAFDAKVTVEIEVDVNGAGPLTRFGT